MFPSHSWNTFWLSDRACRMPFGASCRAPSLPRKRRRPQCHAGWVHPWWRHSGAFQDIFRPIEKRKPIWQLQLYWTNSCWYVFGNIQKQHFLSFRVSSIDCSAATTQGSGMEGASFVCQLQGWAHQLHGFPCRLKGCFGCLFWATGPNEWPFESWWLWERSEPNPTRCKTDVFDAATDWGLEEAWERAKPAGSLEHLVDSWMSLFLGWNLKHLFRPRR